MSEAMGGAPSQFHFVDPTSRVHMPDALGDTIVTATSAGLGWDGLRAEVGVTHAWSIDGLTTSGHFVSVNLDSAPLSIERRRAQVVDTVVMPPGSLWISPAGQPIRHRTIGTSRWASVEITVDKVRRLVSDDLEPAGGYGLVDPAMRAVMVALADEVAGRGASGPLFADALGLAIAARLAAGCGRATTRPAALSPERFARVRERIEDRLGELITVEELASVAGLSPAHFARAFKEQTRETPHGYIVRRRLERARELLARGLSISDAALASGFCDQAHLSRMFRRRFGVTPGAFVRNGGLRR